MGKISTTVHRFRLDPQVFILEDGCLPNSLADYFSLSRLRWELLKTYLKQKQKQTQKVKETEILQRLVITITISRATKY